jgi:type II secretory pathway pseudopilin PulG
VVAVSGALAAAAFPALQYAWHYRIPFQAQQRALETYHTMVQYIP